MEQKDYLSYSFFVKEGFNSNFPDLSAIIHKSNDISKNIWALDVTDLSDNILDTSGNFINRTTVVDVARQDAQIMLIQQNSLYLVGTITIATLLITAILLSK